MDPSNIAVWLRERTPLSLMPAAALESLVEHIEEQSWAADQQLFHRGDNAKGLYILWEGRLENQTRSIGDVSFLPGTVLNLEPLLLDQPVERTVVTLSPCRLWFVPAEQVKSLLQTYPDVLKEFTRKLAADVKRLSFQAEFEQERQAVLRPYLVPKARRGVVGRSRYAVRLRNQIRTASQHRRPVLIFGEPGLEKDNLAALIHYGSDCRREPIVQLDCSKLQTSGADLFGRAEGKPGIVESLDRGTMVLNNIQELPPELLHPVAQLVANGTYRPVSRADEPSAAERSTGIRIILISEKTVPIIDGVIDEQIKVPPLRVRKADISDQVDYYLNLICRSRGIPRVKVAPEAIRRLQAYDFPNNLRELENLVQRAIAQLTLGEMITEEIIWPSQSKKKQFRLNLLNAYPRLRKFLRSPWWPDRINYGFTLAVFALVVFVLFVGPQTRDRNAALNVFWAWWWPLVLLSFPFVGRLWCAVCPFMIYGEVAQKLSLWLVPRRLKRWPRQRAERWGGWFLFALFSLILVWEEVWDLENTAYLSACLLLLITSGAVIFSILFERRFWCRYLCPIGGMNGMFAKLSMTELRAQQGTCSAECTTYQCYKGGPQKGEGQATDGCPLYSHPAQLEDNRDCVLCMTCLKACPHRSVEFNLRPPGIELWTTHQPRSYEAALLFLLLGAVYLHRLPEIQRWLGWDLPLANGALHALIAFGVLILPAIAPLLAQATMHFLYSLRSDPKPRPLIQLVYGYLPLVWAANLAHFLKLGLNEGGQVFAMIPTTLGLPETSIPVWAAHPAVIAFLQGCTLCLGALLSIVIIQRIARQSLRVLIPHCLVFLGLTISFWHLIVSSTTI